MRDASASDGVYRSFITHSLQAAGGITVRRIFSGLCVAVLAISLYACTRPSDRDAASAKDVAVSATVAASETVVPPVPPTPPTQETVAHRLLTEQQVSDIVYIGVLDLNHVRYASKEAAINFGHTVCTARAEGNSDTEIGLTIVNSGLYSYADAGVIVGSAESAYCPDYK
ncbi:DUF732 domain-containing protein [Nocardia sp. NPDC051911]|uniref:DUF732 domain-containing protein n=1 Tax=Nocardia sp. NPDC051911 TaxID=3154648 RepID=UPI00344AC270